MTHEVNESGETIEHEPLPPPPDNNPGWQWNGFQWEYVAANDPNSPEYAGIDPNTGQVISSNTEWTVQGEEGELLSEIPIPTFPPPPPDNNPGWQWNGVEWIFVNSETEVETESGEEPVTGDESIPSELPEETTQSADDPINLQLPPPMQLLFVVNARIGSFPQPVQQSFSVKATVLPPIPILAIGQKLELQNLIIRPIPLPLRDAINEEVSKLLEGKIESFFDNDRVLKTLLNFGTDYQSLIVNWKSGSNSDIVVKLYNPLPPEVVLDTPTYISRELSYPILDRIYVIRSPGVRQNVYLRPPNKRIKVSGQFGQSVQNATLETLLTTGSFDLVRPADRIVEEWYTTALEGSELNVDYSNYRNFIFYGSAEKRLEAFKNKLTLLEDLNRVITLNSSSLALTGSANIISSSVYNAVYSLAQDRQDIIRSFDGYERFLYYESNVPMSGTFTNEITADEYDPWYFHSDATWPKISGSVAPIASASVWYDDQAEIAQAYDLWNRNRFVNNLPDYIRNDDDSEEFLRFFDLIGHMFDTIKLYIDQMPYAYSRHSNPEKELSVDLIWDIAKAFGIDLPNQYGLSTLLDYTIGTAVSGTIYRQTAAETWKRFLHNQIFMMKTKGTKTALRTLLNAYGILPTTVQIRETSTPSFFYATQSFEIVEEQTNALDFETGSYLQIPWSSSVSQSPITVQFRFNVAPGNNKVLLNTIGNTWAVRLDAAPTGTYYRLNILSGSTSVLSSSYQDLGSGDYYNVMIQKHISGSYLYLKQADNDGDLILDELHIETAPRLTNVWDSPSTVYLGGSGSFYGQGFAGNIDEFRIWGEFTSEATFDNWVRYPGLYNGNNVLSARDYLWARLSFNIPKNLGSATLTDRLVPNESPHQNTSNAVANMAYFSASGFPNEASWPYSMDVESRTVQRFSPSAGGTQFDSNKIVIDAAPDFNYMSGSSIPVLSKTVSVISPKTKSEEYRTGNNIVGFYFSTTEAVNDSIIRTIGNVDLHDYIGDPGYAYSSSYDELKALNKLYWDYYAYEIDTNAFIDFVRNLMGPLFEQAKQLVPARAKLITGVVIEPHILERNKHPLKPLRREDDDILNLEHTNKITYQPGVVTGSYDDKTLILPLGNNTELELELTDHYVDLDTNNILVLDPSYSDYQTDYKLSNELALVPMYTDYSDVIPLFNVDDLLLDVSSELTDHDVTFDIHNFMLESVRMVGTLPYQNPSSPTITSKGDFDIDPYGTTNYFTDRNGFVGTPVYVYVRTKQRILNDRGTWVQGTMYNKNDMVLQPTISGSQYSPGNGKEFYAIGNGFISNIPPYGDTTNWRPVAYTPVLTLSVKKAILINGELSLVAITRTEPPVQGYLPQHYRYFKPRYTAFTRARYDGCVQTVETTTDGKDPVEKLSSAGDILVVQNTSEPIQTEQDTGGPILDVE